MSPGYHGIRNGEVRPVDSLCDPSSVLYPLSCFPVPPLVPRRLRRSLSLQYRVLRKFHGSRISRHPSAHIIPAGESCSVNISRLLTSSNKTSPGRLRAGAELGLEEGVTYGIDSRRREEISVLYVRTYRYTTHHPADAALFCAALRINVRNLQAFRFGKCRGGMGRSWRGDSRQRIMPGMVRLGFVRYLTRKRLSDDPDG